MEIALVLLMALTVTGVSIFAITKQEKDSNKVFKYTSFEDEQNTKHVFLVYSPNFKLAQEDAAKIIAVKGIEIAKIEQLDAETLDIIETPFTRSEKSFVKIKKIM